MTRPPYADASHPSIPPRRIGVLIANLGTPDGTDYWSMRRYLNEFLSDKRVIDLPSWKWQPILQGIVLTKRPFTSGANYRSIWNTEANESPLMTITRKQTQALRDLAQAQWGDRVMVDFCMRYGNPSTESVVSRMVAEGCDRILFLPLYPQYAGATWATANDQFFRALMKQTWQPAVRTVAPYFDRPEYIEALAGSVLAGLGGRQPQRLVASYHGMPRRYLMQGDPYHCQCQKTTRLLREHLGWPEGSIDTTFQSVFGREEWLRPYTVEHVADLARQGVTDIAVVSPAFAADCIETLEEIQGEIREAFLHAGGKEFTYIPCLNDDPAHIRVLGNIIAENLGGWV
ncbi:MULTISPECIES: ferrochelatase [unclassified Paracoccus (in: a-proteobacteria)]|uniref:ferrochelatase n=1 Tax=unclassified Paracoccus (in: a-proteobacteria) TaxID=2688777 RepID=UPI0012B1B979|nr:MULTISPECIES: ferrochelatase [unclassified Paracoccus (in: a-proteobacteria)]UXU75960.1 ferrochelatase [Paracoccus sp. SMMA_5]UXU81869.1 ferrochelatase [Paracoccus sp. SMMA_5_TC]